METVESQETRTNTASLCSRPRSLTMKGFKKSLVSAQFCMISASNLLTRRPLFACILSAFCCRVTPSSSSFLAARTHQILVHQSPRRILRLAAMDRCRLRRLQSHLLRGPRRRFRAMAASAQQPPHPQSADRTRLLHKVGPHRSMQSENIQARTRMYHQSLLSVQRCRLIPYLIKNMSSISLESLRLRHARQLT